MNVLNSLEWRYAVKKFDPSKKLSKEQVETLKKAFNLTPTSFGLQPIKMIVIENKELQEKFVEHSYFQRQVADASHLLIFCIENDTTADDVNDYFDLEKEIRGTSEEIIAPFRNQLVENAKAAIDAVDSIGFVDRERVAIGGHSYGAFMVANLLSHSDLFAAGIARSGAYNRTLTPFGFQSEERNYWEAPDVYYQMSPFMHADKVKSPILLIHGEADNNSGTYPLQSERYFNALKGLGVTTRLVILPKESHGYQAKESILHLLWEQDQWLDKYVKNKIFQQPG